MAVPPAFERAYFDNVFCGFARLSGFLSEDAGQWQLGYAHPAKLSEIQESHCLDHGKRA
jgi:hypothetical protein